MPSRQLDGTLTTMSTRGGSAASTVPTRIASLNFCAEIHDTKGVGSVIRWFGVEPLSGRGAFYLWRSFYLSEMVTMRTKFLLAFDWVRSKIFGRDISRV